MESNNPPNTDHINDSESNKSKSPINNVKYTGKYKGTCPHLDGSGSDARGDNDFKAPMLCINHGCKCIKKLTCMSCYNRDHLDPLTQRFVQLQDLHSYLTTSHQVNILTNINNFKPVIDTKIDDIRRKMYAEVQNIATTILNSLKKTDCTPINAQYITNNHDKFDNQFILNVLEVPTPNCYGSCDKQKNVYICIETPSTTLNTLDTDPTFHTTIVDYITNEVFNQLPKITGFEDMQQQHERESDTNRRLTCPLTGDPGEMFPERTENKIRAKSENKTTTDPFADLKDTLLSQLKHVESTLDVIINQYKTTIKSQKLQKGGLETLANDIYLDGYEHDVTSKSVSVTVPMAKRVNTNKSDSKIKKQKLDNQKSVTENKVDDVEDQLGFDKPADNKVLCSKRVRNIKKEYLEQSPKIKTIDKRTREYKNSPEGKLEHERKLERERKKLERDLKKKGNKKNKKNKKR